MRPVSADFSSWSRCLVLWWVLGGCFEETLTTPCCLGVHRVAQRYSGIRQSGDGWKSVVEVTLQRNLLWNLLLEEKWGLVLGQGRASCWNGRSFAKMWRNEDNFTETGEQRGWIKKVSVSSSVSVLWDEDFSEGFCHWIGWCLAF